MALTAWETYVEDVLQEKMQPMIRAVNGSHIGKFVTDRLTSELKRFNTPNSEKTKKLFLDYLDVDVTLAWEWQHFDLAKVKKTLDELIVKRGDAVHRSKPPLPGIPAPHLVKREDLDKSIKFLRLLVAKTDEALEEI